MTLDRRTANFLDLLEGDGLGWANRLSFVSSFSAIQSRDILRVRLGSVRERYIRPLAAEDVFHGIRSCGRLSSRKKKRRPVFTLCLERKQPLLNIFARLSLLCAQCWIKVALLICCFANQMALTSWNTKGEEKGDPSLPFLPGEKPIPAIRKALP